MSQIESDPSDVESFIQTAKALRKADQRAQSDTLLGLLGDILKERGLWSQRLQVIKEVARLSRHPAQHRGQIDESLRKSLGSHRSFDRVFAFAKFSEPQSNPVERAEKIETWLTYDEGECFFMAGRGAGVVTELNPELGICRLDFEKEKRVSIPLGAAAKFLTALGNGHVLREKISDPVKTREEAVRSPAEFCARILQSFDRPMAMAEVRDAVIGIVPETKWTSWWTAARKNPRIVVSGSGTKATYSWSASAGEAASTVRKEFDRADVKTKLDIARKHSGRGKELADYFSSSLAAAASKLGRTDAAMAWQILTVLESLPGEYARTIDPASLLGGQMASRAVAAIGDKALRERALEVVRRSHPDWPKVYGELFFLDDEPRMLTTIINELEAAGFTEIRDRLVDETLRYPRRHPRAFHWYAKRLNDDERQAAEKGNYALLFQLLDAVSSDEFAPVRPRLKDLFDKGGLAVKIVLNQNDEEQARKLVEIIDRYGAVEEYRRENVKHAAFMKHPALREPQQEPVYATAESLEKKRAEFTHLKTVDIPANSRALQAAREMGDLRENFEYKAARQRGRVPLCARG